MHIFKSAIVFGRVYTSLVPRPVFFFFLCGGGEKKSLVDFQCRP